MSKKIHSSLLIFFIFSVVFTTSLNFVSAQILNPETKTKIDQQSGTVQTYAGYSASASVGSVVATVIKAFLGMLGIIFIVLMVLAGYSWMTAAGEEQKIEKAKDTIRAAVIGIIIIVAAYSITYFVISALSESGGGV